MKRFEEFTRCVLVIAFGASLALGLQGCRPSTSEIGGTVKTSMQQTLDSDPQFKDLHLTVESITVIRAGGNVYQGLAKVRSATESHDIPVKITDDGNNMMWQTEPGAFAAFAADNLRQPLPRSMGNNNGDSEIYFLPGKAMGIIENAYTFQANVPDDMRHGHWNVSRVPQSQAEAIAGNWAILFVHYRLSNQNVDCAWTVEFLLSDIKTQSHEALDGCAKTMFEPKEDPVPNSN